LSRAGEFRLSLLGLSVATLEPITEETFEESLSKLQPDAYTPEYYSFLSDCRFKVFTARRYVEGFLDFGSATAIP